MPVSAAQKTAIEEVIRAITSASSRRAKRRLADMFMDLVDRESWPEYYEVPILRDTISYRAEPTPAVIGYSSAPLYQRCEGESCPEQVQESARRV